MERETFEQQIKRLQGQWPNSYGGERKLIIWDSFKDVSNFDFRDAVTDCLGSCRTAPLVAELTKAVQYAKTRSFTQNQIKEASAFNMLHDLAQKNKTTDPEFVLKCINLLDDFHSGKINKEQFNAKADILEQAAKIFMKDRRSYAVSTD